MKNYKNKTIGLLGGMGPEASSSMYKQIIDHAQKQYGAVQDFDFPPVLLYSLPMYGFDETGIVDSKLVKKQLVDGVKTLEKAGSDLVIIACNTVHCFVDQMQNAVNIPILNMVQLTSDEVKKAGFKKVGLLSSQNTANLGLYQNELKKHNIHSVCANPVQQKTINEVIKHVMGGVQGKFDVIELKKIIAQMVSEGAQSIVLGCTEIPLAIDQTNTDIKLFDAMEITVNKAVAFSIKQGKR